MNHKQLSEIVKLIQSGKLEHALKAISRLKKDYGKNQALLHLAADIYRKQEKNILAAETYVEAAVVGGKDTQICWYNAGSLYQRVGKHVDAVKAYKNSLALNPMHERTRNNLCVMLYNSNKALEAVQHAKWISSNSKNPEHLVNAGFVLRAGDCLDEADNTFKLALELSPNNPKIISAALQSAEYVCDWDALELLSDKLLRDYYNSGKFNESRELHHVHISWCDDEYINYQMAKAATKRIIGDVVGMFDHNDHQFSRRVKIGYVSSDFFNHATLHLLIGVLENHNKEKFEVFAYCHSMVDKSSYRKRFISAVDNFKDISLMSDDEAADLIFRDGIDILIDLKGFTDKNRLKIFAKRPAPIQVTYIGYPGTSGADFFDYVISDKHVTPDSSKPFYSEKLCRLPGSYQCNDNGRPVASNVLKRSDFNLPDGAFVFCSFNQTYKFDRPIFKAWCEILYSTDNSVLWILNPGNNALKRLRRELELSGVNPERLIVANKVPPLIHLKRLMEFADLALDTRIVNGHTTTSDALWVGVPVLALYGKHFNSRVSSSLLSNVGLSELVTFDLQSYISKAINLANNPESYIRVKNTLLKARFENQLFDTVGFTRSYEHAFDIMIERYKLGVKDHIDVPNISEANHQHTKSIKELNISYDLNDKSNNPILLSKYFEIRQDCPICNSPLQDLIRRNLITIKIDGIEDKFTSNWVKCKSCGHIYRKESLSTEFLDSVINSTQLPSISREESYGILKYALDHGTLNYREEQPKILLVYPSTPMFFGTCIEFGYIVSAIVDPNNKVSFMNLSKSAVVADFFKINITGNPDFIFVERALEHTINPKAFFVRADAILNKGGLLGAVFSNHSSFEWFNMKICNKYNVWDSCLTNNLYSINSMQSLSTELGYKVLGSFPIPNNEAGVFILFQKV